MYVFIYLNELEWEVLLYMSLRSHPDSILLTSRQILNEPN